MQEGIITLVLVCMALYVVVRPIIKGAIYFPTSEDNVRRMIVLSEAKESSKVVDLGSGDGRILIAYAEKGIAIDGYEINPLLVLYTHFLIKKRGLGKYARVYWKSLWRVNLSQYDVIIVYGIPYIMEALEQKIQKEAKKEVRIISNMYTFPRLTRVQEEAGVRVYKNVVRG